MCKCIKRIKENDAYYLRNILYFEAQEVYRWNDLTAANVKEEVVVQSSSFTLEKSNPFQIFTPTKLKILHCATKYMDF